MARVIVLEGPDGSGKSTLGAAISERLGVPFEHDGGPSRDHQHCRERMNEFIVYEDALRDRSTVFSDFIYKTALGQTPLISFETVMGYVHQAAKRGTLLIYTRPPLDVLMRNVEFLARAKPHKPPEYAEQLKTLVPKIADLYDKHTRIWATYGLPIIRYDYTSTKLDDFLEDIEWYWKQHGPDGVHSEWFQ